MASASAKDVPETTIVWFQLPSLYSKPQGVLATSQCQWWAKHVRGRKINHDFKPKQIDGKVMEQDNKALGLDGGGRVVGEAVSMIFIGISSGQIPSRHIGFFNQKIPFQPLPPTLLLVDKIFTNRHCWSMARFDQIVERYNYIFTLTVTTDFNFATFVLHKVAWFF